MEEGKGLCYDRKKCRWGENMDKGKLKEAAIHGTAGFPLAVYRQEKDEPFIVKLHWHEETEIIFFKKGRFNVEVNMKKYKVQAPSFFFIGSGDIHSIYGETGCLESAVVFDMKMLSFEDFDGVQSEMIRPLLDRTVQFPPQLTQEDGIWQEIEGLYQKILSLGELDNLASRLRVKAYLYEMLACFYESGSLKNMENAREYDSEKIENIKKVLGFIHENCGSRITIKELAEMLRMNEQYFCRYFKKIMGKKPTEYINEVRIEKAAGYLQQSGRKIIDIAMECGYDNMGYFIKRFKEQKGMLPSEYRRKSQNSIISGQN